MLSQAAFKGLRLCLRLRVVIAGVSTGCVRSSLTEVNSRGVIASFAEGARFGMGTSFVGDISCS